MPPERDARSPASRLLDGIALANELVVAAALLADLVLTFCNTIGRYGFGAGLQWSTDFSLICLAIIAFLGSAGYYRRGSGMAYTAMLDAVGRRTREALGALGICVTIGVCLVSLAWFPPVLRLNRPQAGARKFRLQMAATPRTCTSPVVCGNNNAVGKCHTRQYPFPPSTVRSRFMRPIDAVGFASEPSYVNNSLTDFPEHLAERPTVYLGHMRRT